MFTSDGSYAGVGLQQKERVIYRFDDCRLSSSCCPDCLFACHRSDTDQTESTGLDARSRAYINRRSKHSTRGRALMSNCQWADVFALRNQTKMPVHDRERAALDKAAIPS